ncbi:hypothetical protein [Gluconobacter morbifer]|uniref:hypothetical protein n=1 Tax=Gluconobacter morbifer TaxID=479935 RepID=UPI00111213AC|nr:hypothetical protein [Gluconobacter morbifer]
MPNDIFRASWKEKGSLCGFSGAEDWSEWSKTPQYEDEKWRFFSMSGQWKLTIKYSSTKYIR